MCICVQVITTLQQMIHLLKSYCLWMLQFTLKVLIVTSYCLGLNTPLNVTDHLRPLTNVLWEVRPRWYHLGIQLNIDQPTLEVSVLNHPV